MILLILALISRASTTQGLESSRNSQTLKQLIPRLQRSLRPRPIYIILLILLLLQSSLENRIQICQIGWIRSRMRLQHCSLNYSKLKKSLEKSGLFLYSVLYDIYIQVFRATPDPLRAASKNLSGPPQGFIGYLIGEIN